MFIFISSLIPSYFLFFEDFEDFRSDWWLEKLFFKSGRGKKR